MDQNRYTRIYIYIYTHNMPAISSEIVFGSRPEPPDFGPNQRKGYRILSHELLDALMAYAVLTKGWHDDFGVLPKASCNSCNICTKDAIYNQLITCIILPNILLDEMMRLHRHKIL